MILFTYPWAFLGLLAIPALVVVYCLHNRFRRQPVSSLMLWQDHREVRATGTRLDRLQTPLLFFLELLAILLLAGVAVDPLVRRSESGRPLIVVLDDSYSMQGGGADSPRAQGLRALEAELAARRPSSIRFILTGRQPQALSESSHGAREALAQLPAWKCRAPTAELEPALGLAAELGGDWARLLVVTDHAPPPGLVPDRGRVQWWAFGWPRPNLAFVTAVRGGRDGRDRCLLEVANLSPEAQTTTLRVEAGDPAAPLHQATLDLAPGQVYQLPLPLKEGTPTLHATLGDDELAIDNRVTLIPAPRRPVRLAVAFRDKSLRSLVDRAVQAVGGTVPDAAHPDLFLTDGEGSAGGGETWVLRLVAERRAVAYGGPFVLDRTHPLTEGLSLRGIAWAAGTATDFPGAPVILAGNVPLLTDIEGPGSRHEVRLRLRPDLSNLPDDPAWPVLISNLLRWRAAHLPGLNRANVRLGEETVLTLPAERDTVRLVAPDGTSRTLPVDGRRVAVRAESVGVWEWRDGDTVYPFAVNALSREESDLTSCTTGRWGDWLDETTRRLEYQDISWMLLLALLALATLHMFLVWRQRRAAA